MAPTRKRILDRPAKEKFPDMDETPCTTNGEKGYVWAARGDNAAPVPPMAT